jgi:hypothetical protein
MTLAVIPWLEFLVTVGGVFALFLGLAFGLLWIWNH